MSTKKHLDAISQYNRTRKGFDYTITKLIAKKACAALSGDSVLELGCSDGTMTEWLVEHFSRIVAVDDSLILIKQARRHIGNKAVFIHSLFETLDLKEKFDAIILSHVLEHLKNPVKIIGKLRNWMNRGARVFFCVPNALSLHRELGREMGLVHKLTDLSETDVKLEHFRVYMPHTFRRLIVDCGYKVEKMGGVLLKPFPNYMMEDMPQEIVEAYYELGEKYPQRASEIYIIAR